MNNFVGNLDKIHHQRISDAESDIKQQKQKARAALKAERDQKLQQVKQDALAQNESLLSKIKYNLQVDNSEVEKRLVEKR